MKPINPIPTDRPDGGADYSMPSCPVPCYSVSKEGMSIDECPFLEIKPGWVYSETYCGDEAIDERKS